VSIGDTPQYPQVEDTKENVPETPMFDAATAVSASVSNAPGRLLVASHNPP
jgi:hypothetical protein